MPSWWYSLSANNPRRESTGEIQRLEPAFDTRALSTPYPALDTGGSPRSIAAPWRRAQLTMPDTVDRATRSRIMARVPVRDTNRSFPCGERSTPAACDIGFMFGALQGHRISSFRASGRPASCTAVSGTAIPVAPEQPIRPPGASSGRGSFGPTWSVTGAHGKSCWKAVGAWRSSGSARCEQRSPTSLLAPSTTGSGDRSANSRRASTLP